MSREDCIALQPFSILSTQARLLIYAWCEFEVGRAKDHIHFQTLCDLPGHVTVAGSKHSVIGFVEKNDIGPPEYLVTLEELQDGMELDALLDIPLGDP